MLRFPELQLRVRNLGLERRHADAAAAAAQLRRRRQAPAAAEGRRHPGVLRRQRIVRRRGRARRSSSAISRPTCAPQAAAHLQRQDPAAAGADLADRARAAGPAGARRRRRRATASSSATPRRCARSRRGEKVPFVDLFTPTPRGDGTSRAATPLTDNGIHLNEAGDTHRRGAADGGARASCRRPRRRQPGPGCASSRRCARRSATRTSSSSTAGARSTPNTWSAAGSSRSGRSAFPPEMRQLDEILDRPRQPDLEARARDRHGALSGAGRRVREPRRRRPRSASPGHANETSSDAQAIPGAIIGRGPLPWLHARRRRQIRPEPNRGGDRRSWPRPTSKVALERLKPAAGYEISLFASEKEFPELANPLAMTFDTRGRLWVLTSPTYPHVLPGRPAARQAGDPGGHQPATAGPTS